MQNTGINLLRNAKRRHESGFYTVFTISASCWELIYYELHFNKNSFLIFVCFKYNTKPLESQEVNCENYLSSGMKGEYSTLKPLAVLKDN